MSRACPLKAQKPANFSAAQTVAVDAPPPKLLSSSKPSPPTFAESLKAMGGMKGFLAQLETRPEEEREEFIDAVQGFYPAQN